MVRGKARAVQALSDVDLARLMSVWRREALQTACSTVLTGRTV